MPRPLRIEFENAWYHVMNRGANKQFIFESNSHKNLFYSLLKEIVDRFKVEIHAFCLLDNHFHLLIKTPYGNLSKAMRHLDGVYTQRYNKLTSRDGPLFRGRYKAILIDSDQYILQVSRYIHLNPVEAKICKDPNDFKWSSYLFYTNKKQAPSWLSTSFTLNLMSGHDKMKAYFLFVSEGNDEKTMRFYQKKRIPTIYADKKFTEKHLNNIEPLYADCVLSDINHTKPLPKEEVILSAVAKHFNLKLDEFRSTAQGKRNLPRMISIYLLRHLGHIKHKDIAKIFSSLKEKSISPQINRVRLLLKNDIEVKTHINDICREIKSN